MNVLSCHCAPPWHLTGFWGVSRAVPAPCAHDADAELAPPAFFFSLWSWEANPSTKCCLPGEVLSWNTGPAQAGQGFQQGYFCVEKPVWVFFLVEEGENQFPKGLAKKR